MINKQIVFDTMKNMGSVSYIYENQIPGLIEYIKHYSTVEDTDENWNDSVREGVEKYFELQDEHDRRRFAC
jgi:hypothetical protein